MAQLALRVPITDGGNAHAAARTVDVLRLHFYETLLESIFVGAANSVHVGDVVGQGIEPLAVGVQARARDGEVVEDCHQLPIAVRSPRNLLLTISIIVE